MRQFSPQELHDHLAHGTTRPLLLDVREPWEFEICHLDGAMIVPMRQVPNAQHDLDKAAEIVVICHHGIRSRQVCLYLEHMGFTNVINLDGGVEAWAHDVDPTMKRY